MTTKADEWRAIQGHMDSALERARAAMMTLPEPVRMVDVVVLAAFALRVTAFLTGRSIDEAAAHVADVARAMKVDT